VPDVASPAASSAGEPTVRAYQPSDRQAARQLLTSAFGRAAVAELAEELRGSSAHRAAVVADAPAAAADAPAAAADAPAGSALAGLVQLSRGWLDAPARLLDVLVLSPLGVQPELQGRGIGGALVRAAIDTAHQLAAPLLFLEGSPRYHPRFGFRPGGQHGFLRPSTRIPEPAFQVIMLPGWQPWMVGALVYPDAFWRHDSVGLRDR